MCPLRLILVFFSAILAGYFAWRTVRSSSPEIANDVVSDETKDKQESDVKKIIQDGFWVFINMASGKYLWRNLKEMKKKEEATSS